MPCGKRPLVKNWDRPRNIRVIKPSRLEKTETSVKVHWNNVIKDLESSYRNDRFWDSYSETVRNIVGPNIFRKLEKIYNLPTADINYKPLSEKSSQQASTEFYRPIVRKKLISATYSTMDFDANLYKEDIEETGLAGDVDKWSSSSDVHVSKSKSVVRIRSSSRTTSSRNLTGSPAKLYSRTTQDSADSGTFTSDDLIVHLSGGSSSQSNRKHSKQNPHFDMLYCNESETDMIKWKSKYKQKTFEVSASDEFSKKAEIMTKKIAKDFHDWWEGLGSHEFKSELRCPEDIEALFQVWFDEHASRGLVLDPKIIPCVLESIANYLGIEKAACPKVLKRQVAFDVHAETSPPHTVAFSKSLPQKMKHISPQNNTKELWGRVKIPQDIKSMACVWEDIKHLTSTKEFHKWLKLKGHVPMPSILKEIDKSAVEKKQPFVLPSDYVLIGGREAESEDDLEIPVSKFQLELKDVLSKLSV